MQTETNFHVNLNRIYTTEKSDLSLIALSQTMQTLNSDIGLPVSAPYGVAVCHISSHRQTPKIGL